MTSHQAANKMSQSGILFFSSLCASTFSLGVWQSIRYFEKIKLIQTREEELKLAPIQLEKDAKCSFEELVLHDVNEEVKRIHNNDNSKIGGNEEGNRYKERGFTPCYIEGKFRHEDEIIVGPRGPPPGAISSSGPNSGRSSGGMASSPQGNVSVSIGYFVITPLERSNEMGTVLINRGWVPRNYVLSNMNWERPNGIVNLIGVPAKTESPRFLSPPHPKSNERDKYQHLLWMDRRVIEQKSNTVGLSPLLVTQTSNKMSQHDDILFPVQPDLETVGEFKVTPATHAGYAVTWFGLSGAGIIMTKKLISRGRL